MLVKIERRPKCEIMHANLRELLFFPIVVYDKHYSLCCPWSWTVLRPCPAHFPQDCWQQLLYCIFKMSSSSSNGSSSHSKTLVQIAAKNRHKQKCGYPVQTSRSSPSIALNPKLKYLHQHQGIQASPQKRRGVSAEPTR